MRAEAPEWHVRASRTVIGMWEAWLGGEVVLAGGVNDVWIEITVEAARRNGRAYLHYVNRDAVRVEVDFSDQGDEMATKKRSG